LIPQFTPIDKATPAERAAVSAALVKDAGMSARQIGVPLTLHDFPGNPSISGGGKKEDPMHASVPLFGLNAPRWRAMQGLEDHGIPGTAAWDGVVARPVEKKAQQLYQQRAKELKRPLWKLIEQGADPLGIGAASSSSSPGAGTRHSDVPDVPAGASLFNTTPAARPAASSISSSSTPHARRELYRTYAIADMESTSNKASRTSSLRRSSTMATIGSTTSEASSRSTLSRVSTTATIGSEPDFSSLTATTTTTKSKAKKKQPIGKQRVTRTKTAAPASPTSPSPSTAPEQPKRGATLKRGRGAAELDDTTDNTASSSTDTDGDINILQSWAEINQEKEDEEGAEPARKRRKSSATSNSNTNSTTTRPDGDGQGQGQQPRRSTRVTRASAAATGAAAASQPAPRGRATKGKKANKRS
jgi:hypothetical protein